MTEKFDQYILKNGMVLLGERMKAVKSVAFDFMLLAGAAGALAGSLRDRAHGYFHIL